MFLKVCRRRGEALLRKPFLKNGCRIYISVFGVDSFGMGMQFSQIPKRVALAKCGQEHSNHLVFHYVSCGSFIRIHSIRNTLNELYKLYVRPHLDYGDVIYHIPHGIDGSEICSIFCCPSSDRNLERNISGRAVQ